MKHIVIAASISSMIFQTKAILAPFTPIHRQINIVYQIGTIISLILIYLSYKRPNGTKYSYVATIYTISRWYFRMIDLEGTRKYIPKENYSFLMLYQMLVTTSILMISIILHGNIKYNPQISTLVSWLSIYCCFKTAFDDFDGDDVKYLL